MDNFSDLNNNNEVIGDDKIEGFKKLSLKISELQDSKHFK